MDVTTNSNLCRFQTNDVRQAARHNIENHEEIVKRVRDTFKPTKDFFEKISNMNNELKSFMAQTGCHNLLHMDKTVKNEK